MHGLVRAGRAQHRHVIVRAPDGTALRVIGTATDGADFIRVASVTIPAGQSAARFDLQTLDDALADGDRVYAVLRGVGQSSDGKGAGLLAPSQEGETLAIRRAYDASGVEINAERYDYSLIVLPETPPRSLPSMPN